MQARKTANAAVLQPFITPHCFSLEEPDKVKPERASNASTALPYVEQDTQSTNANDLVDGAACRYQQDDSSGRIEETTEMAAE